MSEELHPLTQLLLARIESHPDEFYAGISQDTKEVLRAHRWAIFVNTVEARGSPADKQALRRTLDSLAMGKAHEAALDELLNGDARRAEERSDIRTQVSLSANQYAQHLKQLAAQENALTQKQVAADREYWGLNAPGEGLVSRLRKGLKL